MDQPIIRPQNPYVGALRVFPGTLVKVAGKAKPNATRFAINFQTGPSMNPRDDLALHLSPCFTPPRIVRNSLRQGVWGLEEAWSNGAILSPHAPFEIMILTEPDQYKIAVNGGHYCEFRHRIPYHEVTYMTIDGDVDIEMISITDVPSAAPASYQTPSAHAPPYPSGGHAGMPMPPSYPVLAPAAPYPTPYPSANLGPAPGMPAPGPMPTPNTYSSDYQHGGYAPGPAPYPASGPMPGGYMAGPQPTPHGYPGAAGGAGGYPAPGPTPQGAHYGGHQPGHSSSGTTSTPFGQLPIGGKALGTLAGLGLAGAAGAALLSAANPLKIMKKVAKPKMFKHKGGWGNKSSSSSSSSRSSFSSNSS